MQNTAEICPDTFVKAMNSPIEQRLKVLAELGAKIMKANGMAQENSDQFPKTAS